MRVYVVGSLPDTPSPQQIAAFEEACQSLGACFAEKGYTIVLGSINSGTADLGIVNGIARFTADHPNRKVRVGLIARHPVSAGSAGDPAGMTALLPKQSIAIETIVVKAEGNHARLIAGLPHSDVLLLIGGASGTFTTGVAALAMKHPTLALPQFGGAGMETWQALLPFYARGPFRKVDIDRLSGPWDDKSADRVADALEKIRTDNPFVDRIELNQALLSLSVPVVTALWLVMFADPALFFRSLIYPFFIAAGLASCLGSLSRHIVKCYFETTSVFSLSRFVTETVLGLVVAFLLYLLLQVGGVVVSGQTMSVQLTDYQQFSRMTLAMSLVTFGASYSSGSIARARPKTAGPGGGGSDRPPDRLNAATVTDPARPETGRCRRGPRRTRSAPHAPGRDDGSGG